jgi:UDP-GlcNAc:undecaprenyl-phosphate GlcNAc-1-phosphate transferase
MDGNSTLLFLAGTIVPSAVLSCAAVAIVRRMAVRWGLVDQPDPRKVHTSPTPLGGGLAIWLGVVLPFIGGQIVLWLIAGGVISEDLVPAFARPHIAGLASRMASLWILLGAGTVLMVLGLLDDRFGLDWRLRLAVQFAVTACVATQDEWRLTAFVNLPLVTGFLSVIWIVALINAFNMLDNMDGLSGGVAALAAGFLAAVFLLAPDPQTQRPQLFLAGLLLVIIGSLLGFLWHNRPPARIFMGDAGSYFVGFIIAVATLLATYTGYRSTTRHAILAPLFVMAVPLYDMVTVLWIRVRSGRSPFSADRNHFSHRLVELGLTKGQAVLTIYLLTATCGVGALLLHRVDAVGAGLITLLIACVLALIAILETTARRKLSP